MALALLSPPDGTGAAACRVVGMLLAGRGTRTRGALARAGTGALRLALPHPVYNLGADELAAAYLGGGFESARMTGWRYLLLHGREVVASVELAAPTPWAPPVFARITDGRLAHAVLPALEVLQAQRPVRRQRLYIGMLRLPSLHMHALWLRDAQANGVHDLFLPLGPEPACAAARTVLGRDGMLQALLRQQRRYARLLAASGSG